MKARRTNPLNKDVNPLGGLFEIKFAMAFAILMFSSSAAYAFNSVIKGAALA